MVSDGYLQTGQGDDTATPMVSSIIYEEESDPTSITMLLKRISLHERLKNIMKSNEYKDISFSSEHEPHNNNNNNCNLRFRTPGKFVYLDPFWLEKLQQSFAECDDWSWLLRSTKEGLRSFYGLDENS